MKFIDRFRVSNDGTKDIFEMEVSPVDAVKMNVEVEMEAEAIAPTPLVMKRKRDRPKIQRTGRPDRPRKVVNEVTTDPGTPKSHQEVNLVREPDPMTISEAMNSPEEEWKTAMYEEYEAHIANGACDIVDSPQDKKSIGVRFNFQDRIRQQW